MVDKPTVRAMALARRRALAPQVRDAADVELVTGARALIAGRRRVATYAPMPGEPGGSQWVSELAGAVEVLLPVLAPDRDLDWARYRPDRPLVASGVGGLLREPDGPRLGIEWIGEADLIFVPALAVDGRGVRLGRGGGSFDRALARVAPEVPVIAVLYAGEIHDELPAEAHDRPVTGVLLPSGFISLSGHRAG